jgi:hypothetical protein
MLQNKQRENLARAAQRKCSHKTNKERKDVYDKTASSVVISRKDLKRCICFSEEVLQAIQHGSGRENKSNRRSRK